jgi:hypothetical protein
MIIFRPRIAEHDEDRFLRGTPLIERQTDIFNTWGATNLQPFFEDQQNDLMIRYQMNRDVMYVDVIVVLSTLMNQLDYYHYIENAVRINHPFFLETCLESYIPQEMLKVVSDCVHIPLYDEHGNTKEFMEYMNGKSMYPITYKLQGSSQTREFYRYYPVNIDTIITDLSKDDGDRVGNIMDHYNITFSLRLEFNTTGFYYIFSDNIYDMNTSDKYIETFVNLDGYNIAQSSSIYNNSIFGDSNAQAARGLADSSSQLERDARINHKPSYTNSTLNSNVKRASSSIKHGVTNYFGQMNWKLRR